MDIACEMDQKKHTIAFHGTRNTVLSGERLPCIFVLHPFQDYTLCEYVDGRGHPSQSSRTV